MSDGSAKQTVGSVEAAGWRQRTLRGFADRMGPLWTRREGDAWAYAILATADHLNPAGHVHGGLLCALFDHVVSAVAWQAVGRQPCVTVQLNTQFLAPAREGQLLEGRARVTRATASLVFVEGVISVATDEVMRGASVQKIMARTTPRA